MWSPLQGLSDILSWTSSKSFRLEPSPPCWNKLLALNFLGGRGRFLHPLYHLKREWGVWEKTWVFCFRLIALNWRPLRQGFNMLIFEIYFDATNSADCNIRLIMINYALFKTWGQENGFRPPPVFEFLHAMRQMLQHRTTGRGRFGRIVATVKACLNACANVKVQRWNVNKWWLCWNSRESEVRGALLEMIPSIPLTWPLSLQLQSATT